MTPDTGQAAHMRGQGEALPELETLVTWFEQAEEASAEARRLAVRDRDYYDGQQLTSEERAALARRGQPPIVINLIRRKVDYLCGLEKQQRVDPRAYPRNPADDSAAHAASDALRFVTESENYDAIRSEAWRHMMVEGTGGVEVGARLVGGEVQVSLTPIAYDRMFWDPHSARKDFTDANYLGMVIWMDRDEAIAAYGEQAAPVLETTFEDFSEPASFGDKPGWKNWVDSSRQRVRIVQIYYLERGRWQMAVFTRGGVLFSGPSPFVDANGDRECPLILQSAYLDRDNNRYGMVREMIDAQDDYNKRRSKATHILNTRQVIADEGATEDPEQVRQLLAQPDSYIEKRPGMEFRIEARSDMAQGQFQLLQEAKEELGRMGPQAVMSGEGGEAASGTSLKVRQQGAYVELGDLLDGLRQLDTRVFKAIWNRVRQFWDGPRWIRITDDMNAPRFVGLNVPVTDPFGNLQTQNNVAAMDVDIRIEDAPDVVSLQSEEFETFARLLPTLTQVPPYWARIAVELAPNFRSKAKVLKMLDSMAAAPQPGPVPNGIPGMSAAPQVVPGAAPMMPPGAPGMPTPPSR